MGDDVALLFERAARPMRVGFRDELRELLEETSVVEYPPERTTPYAAMLVADEPAPPPGRRWYRTVLLVAAIGVAVVSGVVLVPRTDTGEVPGAPQPMPRCTHDAEQLGVVATQTGDVRVSLMPDGHSFCLTGGRDEPSLGSGENADLVVNATVGGPLAAVPTVVEQGVVSSTAYWYVLDIPEGMPVASVEGIGQQLASFPTRVGRRLLVIDTEFDLRRSDGLTRDVNLLSSTGVVLSTIAVSISPLSESSTDSTVAIPGGPP